MKWAFVIVLSILLLAGCTNKTNKYATDYYTGTQGVEISFMPGVPPNLMYEGDALEVVLQLDNKGTYPEEGAPQGKVFLTGFDLNAINGLWEDQNLFPKDLPGKSPVNPLGSRGLKVYKDGEIRVPFDNERYETQLQATVCYKYRTTATPSMCIDPEPNNIIQNKACTVSTKSLAGGQGAPVALTRLEPRITQDEVFFTAYVENVGGGKVVTLNGFSNCPFDLDYRDVDQVLVSMRTQFGGVGDCNPKGTSADPVRLVGGGGVITCSFKNPGGAAFTTPVEVLIDYAYTKSIKKPLEIQNPNFRR